MEILASFLVASTFALLFAVCVFSVVVAFTIRRRFPALWQAWGEPVEWLSLQRSTMDRHFFNFLDERGYLAAGDSRFSRVCAALRAGWYSFFFLFVAAIFTLAAALFFRP